MDNFSVVNGLRRFETTVDQIFSAAVSAWPNREFVVTETRRFTYAQIDQLAHDLANGLTSCGVRSGDRVAVWMSNSWEWIVTQFAVTKIGAVLTPLNTRLRKADLTEILNDCGAKVVVTQMRAKEFSYVELLDELIRERELRSIKHIIVTGTANHLRAPFVEWEEVISREERPRECGAESDLSKMAYLLYTSGTTAKPKGVCLSHKNLNNCFNMLADFRSGEKLFLAYPLFAITGCHNAVLAMALLGGCIVLQEAFDALEANTLIQRFRCTSIGAMFGVVKDIALAENFDRQKCPDLRHVIVFPRSREQLSIYRTLGVRTVSVSYGMTETTGSVAYSSELEEEKLSTIGRLLPEVELCIRSSDRSNTTGGSSGDIVVRGPQVMLGYFNKPEETAAAIDGQGWLSTGDVGRFDTEGNLIFVGRKSDIYKSSGFNVAAAEVESFLAQHQSIADVAVIGVRDNEKGEVGLALVVLKAGEELTLPALMDFCRGKLASYKIPAYLRFVDVLPRTASGKIKKWELKQIFYPILNE